MFLGATQSNLEGRANVTNKQVLLSISLVLIGTIYVSETSFFPVLLPQISSDLQCEIDNAILLGAYFNYGLAAGVILGVLGHLRASFEQIVMAGMVVFTVGLFAFASSQSCGWAMTARGLQGVGAGLFAPLIPVLLYNMDTHLARSLLTKWAVITGIAASVSPIAASGISYLLGWRMIMLALAILTVACALITFGGNTGQKTAVATKPESKTETKIYALPLMAILLAVFWIYGVVTWTLYSLPLFSHSQGYSDFFTSLLGSLSWICFAISCALVGKLNGVSYRRLLVLSMIMAAVCGIIFITEPSRSIYVIAAIAAGTSMGLANVPSTVLAFRTVSKNFHGIVASADIFCARLGGAIFISIWGVSYTQNNMILALLFLGSIMVPFLVITSTWHSLKIVE